MPCRAEIQLSLLSLVVKQSTLTHSHKISITIFTLQVKCKFSSKVQKGASQMCAYGQSPIYDIYKYAFVIWYLFKRKWILRAIEVEISCYIENFIDSTF